jgi:hypothetical protein
MIPNKIHIGNWKAESDVTNPRNVSATIIIDQKKLAPLVAKALASKNGKTKLANGAITIETATL